MSTDRSLASFRGEFPKASLNARRIASALDIPGCQRRSVLETCNVDINKLAKLVTGNDADRQSPFAITRGNQFEAHVTDHGMAAILALAREHLGLDIPEVREKDLSADHVRTEYPGVTAANINKLRARLTQQYIEQMLTNPGCAINLLRHAMTKLEYGGEVAYLEQDVLAFTVKGRIYVVEIKSYPKVDGRADPSKASETVKQTAVYVLSLQDLVVSIGASRQLVDTRALIVLPENLSFRATATVVDTKFQVERLRRQIVNVPNTAAIINELPLGVSLPPLPDSKCGGSLEKACSEANQAIASLPTRFGDACVSCPLFRYCRAEVERHHSISRLGNIVANTCGSITTIDAALDLAAGRRNPNDASEAAVSELLSRGAKALSLATRKAS